MGGTGTRPNTAEPIMGLRHEPDTVIDMSSEVHLAYQHEKQEFFNKPKWVNETNFIAVVANVPG